MVYAIVWNSKGAITRFTGKVGIEEINQANNEHYGDARYDEIKYQLFDFTEADLSSIAADDAKYPAAYDKAATIYKFYLRVAMVVADDYTQALCEEYIKLSQRYNSGWEFGVFSTLKEALTWCNATD